MIKVPTLLLNEEICRKNIREMALKAKKNKIILRPHFKTHQSIEIGEWFREEGVDRITVSSLRMALYFSSAGWKDILVAFPVNILEIETINLIAGKINLTLLVETPESVDFLDKNLTSHIGLFIKVDTGYHRTGIYYDNIDGFSKFIDSIEKSSLISFSGFLTHAGNNYASRGHDQILAVHIDSVSKMVMLKQHFAGRFPGIKISVGDTPSCSRADDFSMVDEIRPGNFVFYDLMQCFIGSCTSGQVAVAMACPVVAVHDDRNEIIIYGGAVHFSKESIAGNDGKPVYGQVVINIGNGWGDPVKDAYLIKMSQEHGTIKAPHDFVSLCKPGDVIKILPVHSCLTADLMEEYVTLNGSRISKL